MCYQITRTQKGSVYSSISKLLKGLREIISSSLSLEPSPPLILPYTTPHFPLLTSTMAPGLDFYTPTTYQAAPGLPAAPVVVVASQPEKTTTEPYYNERLDPKNYLEGPLSWNPAT